MIAIEYCTTAFEPGKFGEKSMEIDMNNLANVRAAWEDFMSDKAVGKAVRPVVLESWKRSRTHQAPAESPHISVLDTPAMRELSRSSNELLLTAAPVLDHAQKWLSDTHSMLMLTDASGLVLRVSGDRRAISQGCEIGLQQGGFWRESDIGTNAIGTALAVNAPVRIHAFEHFCQQVQRWSCAAAPVRDPRSGHLLGVVDISSPSLFASDQSLAHATTLAQHIHSLLEQQYQEMHRVVLLHLLENLPHWHGRTVVALDRYGKILHSSTPHALHDTPLKEHLSPHGDLSSLEQEAPRNWFNVLNALWPGVELDVIRQQDKGIGALLVLPRQHGRSKKLFATPSTTQGKTTHSKPPQTRPWPLPSEVADAFSPIVGSSAALRATLEHAAHIARSGLPLLLEGETGTGKEMFAHAIHAASRSGKPFSPVNCGALPQELIGSEIFGYERGAFTGAVQNGRAGKLEAADGGTFCLDEIGEMPLNLQPYLLRVLEDQQVFRLGSNMPRQVDVRIIAMTNRDLEQAIHAGEFRQDLFYRISVTHLRIPPLRERADDIPALVQQFAALAAERSKREQPVFSTGAMERLERYPWPGNIRQLRNCIEMLVLLDQHGWIDIEHLPSEILQHVPTASDAVPLASSATTALPDTSNLQQIEKTTMLRVIEECQGNLSVAAKRMGIARSTLYSRLGRLH